MEDDLNQTKSLMQHRQSDFDNEKVQLVDKLTTANVKNDKLDAQLTEEIHTLQYKEWNYKGDQQKSDIAQISLKKTIKAM